jgi:glycosyltransferase involved in cell wall biosynthesis
VADARTICIVNPFEHGGGAEYQISLLAAELTGAQGYQVHFVTHFENVGQRRDYRITRVGDGGPIPMLGYLMEARPLYQALASIRPAVIYQRVACGYTGICAYFSRRNAVPMIWHVSHDTDVGREALDGSRNMLRAWLEKSAVRWGARHASGIVVQTQHQAELLLENYRRPAAAVIPNFHPAVAQRIDKRGIPTVLWIANLKPWKRPEMFVRLAKQLQSIENLRFIMVGSPAAGTGNRAWQDALLKEIQASPNIEFLGQKTQDEVNELLARAHVFVNTSRHEGFPNTFIQAWAREAAVVSLGVDPDGVLAKRGVGIAARSEAELAAAVRRLIENPAERQALAMRGRDHAAAHHSLDNAKRLARLLTNAASGAPIMPVP